MSKEDLKIVIECPLCDKKELQVYTTDEKLLQCLYCGYSSSNDMAGKMGDNRVFKLLDDQMKDMAKEANGQIWIPSIVNLPIGILYPVKEKDDLIWNFAPLVSIADEEKENYKKEDGTYFTKKYDMDKQITFENFGRALLEINAVISARDKMKNEKESSPVKIKLPKLKKLDE